MRRGNLKVVSFKNKKIYLKFRLSDNNCIEIMSKLISMRLVDIIISTDGRDYITRKHLLTEVKNECIANNNRISLVELATNLNVEFNHIENAVSSIIKQSDIFYLCGGELIHKSIFIYFNAILDIGKGILFKKLLVKKFSFLYKKFLFLKKKILFL